MAGEPQRLDIGKWNQRYFVYVASFGAFVRSSYAASQAAKNALGHFAYILEGMWVPVWEANWIRVSR